MENNSKLAVFIILFIGVIVALALMPEIARNISALSDKQIITNELIDITTARDAFKLNNIDNSVTFTVDSEPIGWRQTECPLTSITYGNSTTDWTNEVDYNITESTGILNLYNTTATVRSVPNTTYIDYTYCNEGYITNSGGRGVAKLILIVAALGLAGFAIYMGIKEYL